MARKIFLIHLLLLIICTPSSSSTSSITQCSSLSVENPGHVLVSSRGTFSAGFYSVGDNSFCFAIWLTQKMEDDSLTVIWMANRDRPVNGKLSKLSFKKNGNLVLTDAGESIVWETQTSSYSSLKLTLQENGNLVVHNLESDTKLWQSFDFPTDTLLANQPLTRATRLVSSRSLTNPSSGFYKLFFDYDDLFRLLFERLDMSNVYWPDPSLSSWENGRSTYNDRRTAVFNSSGYFQSTDGFNFTTSDYGLTNIRRLTIDIDGNIRMYSLSERKWMVTWQAIQDPCKIYGICGANALCTHERQLGRNCTCIPGYKMKNHSDWAYGCKPDFGPLCSKEDVDFLELPHTNFYRYDIALLKNYTLLMCKNECLKRCDCMGFQFKYVVDKGYFNCHFKSILVNGYRSPRLKHHIYIKLPNIVIRSWHNNKTSVRELGLDCSKTNSDTLQRSMIENYKMNFMVWVATSIGGIELFLIFIVWCSLSRTQQKSNLATEGYLQVGLRFRKFTYDELRKATNSFSEEIGRGGSGSVYKGLLFDHRVAAIKRLKEAKEGEADFLAEISTISKLNHMNLIEIWGYCAEGKHNLLVYEYMEHGSLANNLTSYALDFEKRFNIAVGTARGLAYLHEECFEWVLHCDVKPQNVLLDARFQAKVADFGLSKLLDRTGGDDSNFSRIRGTRGYMAPEWICNLAITSKVDVYSYGVVVLEMVTGKSPMGGVGVSGAIEMEQRGLVNWARMKRNEVNDNECSFEEIIDPKLEGKYDVNKMELLVEMALQCVEEDKDARPTMREVMEMFIQFEE